MITAEFFQSRMRPDSEAGPTIAAHNLTSPVYFGLKVSPFLGLRHFLSNPAIKKKTAVQSFCSPDRARVEGN